MRTKKMISLLLAVVMLITIIPTTAFATASMSVSVDTSAYTEALKAGAEISIPVKIDTNPGVAVMDLLVDYDKDIFEFVSMTAGTELVGEYTVGNANSTNCVWVDSQGADNTGTGVFFTITLRVLESAAGGATTISIVDQGTYNAAGDTVAVSIVPATITIAGQEAPLTFADGETTYDFATLKADNYTLTAPGVGYHFAGWFSGLTEDADGMITLVDGRYILSDKATPDDTLFENVVECRPKYDEAPESGTYNALWIHEDNTDTFSAMVLEVYENSFKYRKQTYAQTADEVLSNNEAIRKAWTGADGNGRVKLVKDMEVADVTGHDVTGEVVYIEISLKLDMNGRTLSSVEHTAVDAGEPVLEIRSGTTGNVIESSRGQGTMKQLTYSTSSYGNAYVLLADQAQFDVIRDVDFVSEKNPNASGNVGMQVGRCTIGRIERVNVSVSTTGEGANLNKTTAIRSSNTAKKATSIGVMNDCTVASNGYLIYADTKLSDFGTITNCTMTATGTAITSPIYLEGGKIDFGAGNTVTAESSGLFRGAPEISFTSADSTYQCAASGDVLGADVKVVRTPAAGTTAISENGKLVFVSGFTLKFYSYDGTRLLGADRYRTGETPVDHEVTYDIVGLTTYEHLGWATEMNGEPVDVTALQADATLYAIREEVTLDPVVSISVADGEAVGYASWDDAIATLGYSQANQQVLIKLLADTAGSSRIKAGYSQITFDLNGNTFTYTGSSYALHYYDGYSSSTSSFTLTSSAAQKGTVILAEGAKGLVLNDAYSGNIVPVVISNVRIEAPYLAANSTWNKGGAVITVINQSTNRTELLTMTDVEIVAANCPAVEFSIASTNATCKIDAEFENVKLSGNPVAVGSKGSGTPGATHVNLTVDADSTFKGAEDTYPIQETNGNFGLTLSYPDGYVLTEGTDGWWSYKTLPVINGEKVLTATHTATADNGGVVAITGASQLGILDSLTVNADAANLVFSAEALDSIADAGKTTVNINAAVVTDDTVAKHIELTVTDGEGNEIAFTGEVEVTMNFSGTAGTAYAIYYLDGANRVPVSAEIDDNGDGTFTAVFTVSHFSEYVATVASDAEYALTVEFDKDEYKTGDTVTATIKLTGTGTNTNVGGFQFVLDMTGMTGMTLTELASTIDGVQIYGGAIVWAWNNANSLAVPANGVTLATATFSIGNGALGKTIELGLGGTIEVVRVLDNASSPVAVVEDSAKVLYTITITDSNISEVTGAAQDNTDTTKYYTDGAENVTFKVTAPSQTVISKVAYNGTELSGTDGVYTIPTSALTADGTVTVTYIEYYTVTFAAGEHGTLSGTTTAYVKKDESTLYTDTTFTAAFTVPTITANEGYRVAGTEWKDANGNGVEHENIGTNFVPTGNVALTAQYAQNAVITVDAENCTVAFTGGTTQGTGENAHKYFANSSTAVTFTVTPTAGQYVLKNVSYIVNGTSTVLTATDGVYTIPTSVLTDGAEVTLAASYDEYYTVTFADGGHGTLSSDATAYAKANTATLYTDTTFTAAFTVPTITANEGYRVADTQWNDGTNDVQSSALGVSYTVSGNTTLTAQYVKTWTITWDAGTNGSFAAGAVTTKVVDDNTAASDYVGFAPVVNSEAGYVFNGWAAVMTGTVTANTIYTATYSHGKYTLSLPNISGIKWTVGGTTYTGNGGEPFTVEITHGTAVTVQMADVSEDIQVNAIKVNGTALTGFIAGGTTHEWTIAGADIVGNISITIDSTDTYTVTIIDGGDGVSVTTASVTYVSGAQLDLADFGITYEPGYELDKIVDENDTPLADGMTVNEDATYTVTAKHSSFNVTYPDNSTVNATHGTDFVIDMSKATENAVVTAVKYQVDGGEAVTVTMADGKYTIPGAAIIGDITITFEYMTDASWEFISYGDYAALASGSGTQVAILKTDKLSSGTYELSNYADMFWSGKYEGYVYIVSTSENAATLSAKLSANSNTVVELKYDGDINGSGTVTAADATVINAALQQTAGLSYVIDYRMRLEMDVDGGRSVTTIDITTVLQTALNNLNGSN